MFTGLVEDVGLVTAVEPLPEGSGVRLWLLAQLFDGVGGAVPPLGASISIDGVCLTAVAFSMGRVAFDVGPETMARTTFASLVSGKRVNIERAMKLGERLGGHLVSGHIDGVGTIATREARGDSLDFAVDAPAPLGRYIIEKGSICIDGISLTVNEVDGDRFKVSIIPHTQTATTLGRREPGASVNLEVDMIAKYVERLVSGYHAQTTANAGLKGTTT